MRTASKVSSSTLRNWRRERSSHRVYGCGREHATAPTTSKCVCGWYVLKRKQCGQAMWPYVRPIIVLPDHLGTAIGVFSFWNSTKSPAGERRAVDTWALLVGHHLFDTMHQHWLVHHQHHSSISCVQEIPCFRTPKTPPACRRVQAMTWTKLASNYDCCQLIAPSFTMVICIQAPALNVHITWQSTSGRWRHATKSQANLLMLLSTLAQGVVLALSAGLALSPVREQSTTVLAVPTELPQSAIVLTDSPVPTESTALALSAALAQWADVILSVVPTLLALPLLRTAVVFEGRRFLVAWWLMPKACKRLGYRNRWNPKRFRNK